MTHKPATAEECLALIRQYQATRAYEHNGRPRVYEMILERADKVADACEAFIKAVHKEGGATDESGKN